MNSFGWIQGSFNKIEDLHKYLYIYTCIYVYVYIHMYIYTCTYAYMHIYMYSSKNIYTYIHMYLCMNVGICICIYTYVYIHIHIYTNEPYIHKNIHTYVCTHAHIDVQINSQGNRGSLCMLLRLVELSRCKSSLPGCNYCLFICSELHGMLTHNTLS